MPRGDRTGPEGQGPMTGRGLGYCAGYPNPGFINNFFGRGGRGFGRGLGLGFRGGRGPVVYNYPYEYPSYHAPSKEEELNILKAQAKNLKKGLEETQKRISDLETEKSKQ